MTFAETKAFFSGFLRARGRDWREKATEIKYHPEKCLTRADECDACAFLIEGIHEAAVHATTAARRNQ